MRKVFNKLSGRAFSDYRELLVLSCFSLYCALGLFVNTAVGYYPEIKFFINVIRIFIFAVFFLDYAIDILLSKRAVDLFHIILLLASFINFIVSGNYMMLAVSILIVEMGKFNFKELIGRASTVFKICFSIVIILAIVKVFPNNVYFRAGENKIGDFRYTLGFYVATLGPAYFLFIALMEAYLKKTKMSYFELLILLIIDICLFLLTNTRFDFLLTLLILIVVCVAKLFAKHNFVKKLTAKKVVRALVCLVPCLIFCAVALCVYFYSKNVNFFVKLNKVLSGRLYYSFQTIMTKPLTAFGSELNLENTLLYPQENNVVGLIILDVSYFQILYKFGLVNFVIVMGLYSAALYRAAKVGDVWLMFALLICLVDGVSSPFMIDFDYNYFVLALFGVMKGPRFTLNKLFNKRREYASAK